MLEEQIIKNRREEDRLLKDAWLHTVMMKERKKERVKGYSEILKKKLAGQLLKRPEHPFSENNPIIMREDISALEQEFAIEQTPKKRKKLQQMFKGDAVRYFKKLKKRQKQYRIAEMEEEKPQGEVDAVQDNISFSEGGDHIESPKSSPAEQCKTNSSILMLLAVSNLLELYPSEVLHQIALDVKQFVANPQDRKRLADNYVDRLIEPLMAEANIIQLRNEELKKLKKERREVQLARLVSRISLAK